MKQSYLIPSFNFNPSEETLAVIRQFAYTFRPVEVDGRYEEFCLN
jgi:fructose/tagatose bisphosphate aldolase